MRSRVEFVVRSLTWSLLLVLGMVPIQAFGQFDFDEEPIRYSTAKVNDRVAKLATQLNDGRVKLKWDDSTGWLPSLLKELELDAASQSLVFSKTSLQATRIDPSNPRALYFSDDVYLGFVPGGRIIELSAVDPVQGAIFYSIEQQRSAMPKIARDKTECMTCHGTSKTQNVPGYLVRSLFPLATGQPNSSLGSTTTDHTTPFTERYGGWYVTGQHGTMRHRGNAFADQDATEPIMDFEPGANLDSVPSRVDTSKYASDKSDVVALMVLEHQSQMHNAITAASYEARRAMHYDKEMNALFKRPMDRVSDSTKRRIQSAGDRLLKHLLFNDEAKLSSSVKGNSRYAEQFELRGPFDAQRRSLRQFDMQTRMFKYPCSFLIYSESFERLPEPMLNYVESRLVAVLTNQDDDPAFDHLSKIDRVAILEILVETKPAFRQRLEAGKRK